MEATRLGTEDVNYYDAQSFWSEVLGSRFDLTGTGHGGYGPRYNKALYRAKLRAFNRALGANGVELSHRSVLDAGCGVGFFTQVSENAGVASYTGLDITTVAVDELQGRFPTFRFEVADIGADLPAVEPAEIVLCVDVLYHVVDPQRFRRAVDNLWSLVAPGGRLVLVDSMWRRDLIPGGTLDASGDATHIPHVCFHSRAEYDQALFSRGDATLLGTSPMYCLFNRPIEGRHWPWTRTRLAWHLRYRLFEQKPVLAAMYWADGWLTRVRRHGPDLKFAIVEKALES
jgi:SAM-dependent methyltransferase